MGEGWRRILWDLSALWAGNERRRELGQPLGLCQGCSLCGIVPGFPEVLGRGWSQHVVSAAALDAQCCCVLIPAQNLGNYFPLSFSHLLLPFLHPRATGMQLCECWIQEWMGMAAPPKCAFKKSKIKKKIKITQLNQLNTYKPQN